MVRLNLKRSVCALLCLLMIFSAVGASATVYEVESTRIRGVVVNDRGATLRSTPENKGNANKIKSLSSNTYLSVGGIANGWYYVYVSGDYGFVNAGPEWTRIVSYWADVETPERGMVLRGEGPGGSYDMGVPDLHGEKFDANETNVVILWVQTQLKATHEFYQGDIWDVSGTLGTHTMDEIRAFMASRGYFYHSGMVDQMLVDHLAACLGDELVPVYISGMYEYMDSIMNGGSAGSMFPIISNMRYNSRAITTGARWVQTCLKKIGYYKGVIDGMYGQGLEDAVKKFQHDYGFQERDFVSLGVARTMLEVYFAMGGDLNALP